MTYQVKRSEQEIDDQRNAAAMGMDGGSKVPGMSYEEGVSQALGWVLGDYSDAPLDLADYEEDLDLWSLSTSRWTVTGPGRTWSARTSPTSLSTQSRYV